MIHFKTFSGETWHEGPAGNPVPSSNRQITTHYEKVLEMSLDMQRDNWEGVLKETLDKLKEYHEEISRLTSENAILQILKPIHHEPEVGKPKRDQYYIDERLGCIAVRDKTKPFRGPDMKPEYEDVVEFWEAPFFEGVVTIDMVHVARKLCEKLNETGEDTDQVKGLKQESDTWRMIARDMQNTVETQRSEFLSELKSEQDKTESAYLKVEEFEGYMKSSHRASKKYKKRARRVLRAEQKLKAIYRERCYRNNRENEHIAALHEITVTKLEEDISILTGGLL